MDGNSYPELHRSTSTAAASAQRTFLRLRRIELGLLVAGAALAGLTLSTSTEHPLLAGLAKTTSILSVVAIAGALIISVIVRATRMEEIWADCRTVAESVKKLAWLYMMGVPPYVRASDVAADAEYVLALEQLHESLNAGREQVARHSQPGHQITDAMRNTREKTWLKRRDTYRTARLEKQQIWYATRARRSAVGEARMFGAATTAEGAALLLALALAFGWSPAYNGLGVATTTAAAVLAWTQLRRHRQLSRNYSQLAQRLAGKLALVRHVDSEIALARFVQEVEEHISTENTNWAILRS